MESGEFARQPKKPVVEKSRSEDIVGVAFALRYGLTDRSGIDAVRLFHPATLISAWYAGRPGMLAAASGVVLGDFFLPAASLPEGLG